MRDSDNEESFERLVEENKRRLMWIARSYAPADSVNDLYQDILLEIWKGLDGYKARAKIGTWVYRVALNTAFQFRQRARRRLEMDCRVAEERAEYRLTGHGQRSEAVILREFTESLDETDRSIFLMYLDESFTYEDMAEVTGLKEPHIRVKVSRLKSLFRERYIGD